MPRKPLDLPPEVAKAFVADMKAFFAEPNAVKRDEIAGRQLRTSREYQGPRDLAASPPVLIGENCFGDCRFN